MMIRRVVLAVNIVATMSGDCPFLQSEAIEMGFEDEVVDVYFMRHAESVFNEAQRDTPKLIRSFTADAIKRVMAPRGFGSDQSLEIFDSPLSATGIRQAESLQDQLCGGASTEDCPWTDFERTAIATSNLRRASMTFLIALGDRVTALPPSSVYVLSSLQEFQGNPLAVDTVTLSKPGEGPASEIFDARCNRGNQTPSRVVERLNDFCNWMRFMNFENGKSRFALTGHSHWLQKFFTLMLGEGMNDVEREIASGSHKIANAAIIKFQLRLRVLGPLCEVVPGSTTFVTSKNTFA